MCFLPTGYTCRQFFCDIFKKENRLKNGGTGMEKNVKFIQLQFVDAFGILKNITVMSKKAEYVLEGKYRIDGYSVLGRNKASFYLKPDPDTFTILPWCFQQEKTARFLCDLTDEQGRDVKESSRFILKNILRKAEEKGYRFQINAECEFSVLETDHAGKATINTKERAKDLDCDSIENEVISVLEEMGIETMAAYRGSIPAQHKINLEPSWGIQSMDNIITLRAAVKNIAKQYGRYATFMPKPGVDFPGNSMILSFLVYKDGKDIFSNKNAENGISQQAYSFIAGLLVHMNGMTAIANPVVNSYKRLRSDSGHSPELFWSVSDFQAPLCVLKEKDGTVRIQWRIPDGAANPYVLVAAAVEAGLQGIEERMIPLKSGEKAGYLPETLKEAVAEFEKDELLRTVYGDSYVKRYVEEKCKEWKQYQIQITEWEREEYLNQF